MEPKCDMCGNPVDIASKDNWHKVVGWRKNSGGNVQFIEGPFAHACADCMLDKKFGSKPERLF